MSTQPITHAIPVRTHDLVHQAEREGGTLYAARKALFEITNRTLLMVIGAMVIALCATVAFTIGIYKESLQREPLFVGIDQRTGSLMLVKPEAFRLDVNDVLLKGALENFVQMHFERLPVISRRDYNRSLFQMSSTLIGPASAVKDDWKEITDLDFPGQGQEVQVDVSNSTYTGTQNGCHPDTNARPCVATVYLTKTVYNRVNHTVLFTKSSIVTLDFFLRRKVTQADINEKNFLGIEVTDLHESEGH